MPHATDDMSSQTMTNGDKASSKFISHVTSYPVVNDGIETFKSYPIGKKSLEIADGAYQRFGKPVEPYLETPYSYAKPYVEKADELADSGLQQVDSRFPIVREETSTIIDTGKSYILWPRDYKLCVDEYRKTAQHKDRGDGLLTLAMALVSTNLKITSDFFQLVADILGPKYEESKKKGSDYVRQAEDAAEHYKQVGQDKFGEYTKYGQQKAHEYSQKGQEKTEQVKGEAENKKEQAKGTAQQTKDQAAQVKDQAKGQAQQGKEDVKAKTGTK